MGKCLSCFTEDQRFQPECPADHVAPDPLHHEASWVSHPDISFGFKTNCPTIRIVSLPKGSKNSSSNTSIHSSSSGRSHSSLRRFHKSGASLHCQQSRANFDPEEKSIMSDLKCPSEHLIYRSRKHFSTPKLSIISCYESAMFYDPQSSSDIRFNPTEMESISKSSSIADAEKYINSCSPDYNIKHFMNFETKVNSSATRNSVGRDIYQPSTVTFLTIPSLVSYSYQQNEFATDTQERSQLRKDSLYSGSQSHSTDHSPAMIQQHPSQSVTSVPHNVGSSLFYKHTRSFTNTRIKYITASTDTEEQSFPVPKALNTHAEELNLDVLLRKADNLRAKETSKTESFELLDDYKEKFRDEVEFIWRFARAYGDMSELSTNIQEKKHFANIGKTLAEKAVTRAPMNGHCHLWYAVLCGYVSEFEGLQNKVNYGHRFKEHLDKAIQLLPEEPFLYYLNGRYCYAISKLSWIEKKMAATLFGKIPSSTVQEALQNFLKVEDLHPRFSKSNYMYLAKCYIDLKQTKEAMKFCNLAEQLPCVTKE
uniref:Regulator of microtubule dynamics protein 2 n=1 Tax=Molossus molossus TaxID=27622 RepID=A0A7J8E4U0_MOLMO|nr:regulator of microtubule dynamics 2 [Molossus molossus]